MRVLGVKEGKFRDKDTGNWVNYYHLHVADIDPHVIGEAVDILKLSPEVADASRSIKVGDEIEVTYNKFGKPTAVKKVSTTGKKSVETSF